MSTSPDLEQRAASALAAVDQLVATNHVWPDSAQYSWLCGGMWAEERGLRYPAFSPWGSWRAHLRYLALTRPG